MSARRRDMPSGHIGTGELAARARVTVRQIQSWTALGYLAADERHGLARQGSFLTYAPGEVVCALVLAALVHAGVTPHSAAEAARRAIVDDDSRQFGTWIGSLYMVGTLP